MSEIKREPVRARVVRRFDSEKKARKWASAFDTARAMVGHGPMLVVKETIEGTTEWVVTDTYFFPEEKKPWQR